MANYITTTPSCAQHPVDFSHPSTYKGEKDLLRVTTLSVDGNCSTCFERNHLPAPHPDLSGGQAVLSGFFRVQIKRLNSSIDKPESLTIPAIVYALIGLARGMVRILSSSVMIMCLPCRRTLKPAFLRALTARW